MPRQLSLHFGDDASAEMPSPAAPSSEPVAVDVRAVASSLRPRLLDLLANGAVELRELQGALGHPAEYMDGDPQSNPVNCLVKQMRDAGELVVRNVDRGSPLVSLPTPEPAADPVLQPGSWESDVAERFDRNFVQPVLREVEASPWSTSEAIGNRALGRKKIRNVIATAADILHKQMKAGSVQIAWDEQGMPHYALSGLAVPKHLATREQIDAAGGSFPSSEEIPPAVAPPPLVRPDRQCTFDGVPHYDWPKPEEDRDSITVDRLYDDIDGQSHRFLIRRGDQVEVFFRRDKVDCGEVVGISHARREVRVSFREGSEGIWFAVGQCYPIPEERHGDPAKELLPQLEGDRVAGEEAGESDSAVSFRESQPGGVDSLTQRRPYSLQDFRAYRDRFDAGDVSLAEHQAEFARVRATRDAFVTDLAKQYDAMRLKVLASRFGCFHAKRNTKKKNAEHIYRAVLQSFVLGGSVQLNPMSETLEEATVRSVDALTDDAWHAYHEKVAAERADREQALSNPETLEQFRLRIREQGLESLSDEQRVRFDELSADSTRAARKAKVADTVTQIEGEGIDGLEFSIKEGWHDKKECKLWIVQLSERVERDVYRELLRKAKMLGGWFSSFKKTDAGFQFLDEERATRFASLLDGDVDRSDVLEDRKARKMQSAGERLAGVAETLESEAAEILDADEGKLTNTVRRSEMAAGMRSRAYASRAMAGTLRSIATALDAGGAQYLDGVRAATHVEALIGLLRRAKTQRNVQLLSDRGELGMWERHAATEELSNRPLERADAAFALYPYPAIYRRHLEELVAHARNTSGLKQLSRRLDSFLATDRENHFVDFVDDSDVAFLQEYLARCKRSRLETRWVEQGMEDWKRLRAANILTPQELRCSLRELIPHLRRREQDDPVQIAEAKLIGKKLPGFFPTPRPVISRMLELAQIKDGDRVLEPSCGKGDILDMIHEQHPEASVTAIEINGTLFDVLDAKGHDVTRMDFLMEYAGEHDVIVMNPPFEKGESYYLLCVGDASSSGFLADCGLSLDHGDAQLFYQLFVGDSGGHAGKASECHVAGLEGRQKKVAQNPITR